MKTTLLRFCLLAGALSVLALASARAQIVEFRAVINAAQETTGSTSPATGTAVLLYDVTANTFDLSVTVNDFANTITASHIHEGAAGVAGAVVTGLGGEAVYIRTGTTVRAMFTGVPHLGTPLVLLQNGAYINLHSAAFPGGEVRGQLIAQPKRLTAVLTGAQEGATNTSTAYGAAMITYDAGTNKIWTRIDVYNFTNTLTNSHYHEAPVGVSGPVVHGFGGASVYTRVGDSYHAVFSNQTYLGNPIKLLQGLAYLNVHSNVAPAGEIRGQVMVSDELNIGRLANVSSRGFVGTGDQVLITGFVITGTEPVRVLMTARGPSLAAFGVSGALANPLLSLHDSTGRKLMENDDFGTTFSAVDLPGTGFAPGDANESALLVVLPPGVYSTVVRGANGATGVALSEVYEVRARGSAGSYVDNMTTPSLRQIRTQLRGGGAPTPRSAPEFCVATPLASIAR